jgi:hypothetical protein
MPCERETTSRLRKQARDIGCLRSRVSHRSPPSTTQSSILSALFLMPLSSFLARLEVLVVEAASEQSSISRQLPVCSASPASTTNAAPHIRPCRPSLRPSIGFLSPHLSACSCPSQSVAKRHSNRRLTHTATSVAHSQGKMLSGQPVDLNFFTYLHSLPS